MYKLQGHARVAAPPLKIEQPDPALQHSVVHQQALLGLSLGLRQHISTTRPRHMALTATALARHVGMPHIPEHPICSALRLLAIICIVLVIYGVVELGLFFLGGLSTSISMGLGTMPANGLTVLLMSVFAVISAIVKVVLAIVLYGYFSTSKRVRRTLINNDILERPHNR